MGNDRLKKLLEQREAMNARIRREQAKAQTQARKDDTRRKILDGAVVAEWAAHDPTFKAALDARRNRFLTRADDRALFGLPVLVETSAPEASGGDAESTLRGAA